MDFRSQLSAFASGGSGSGSNNNRGGGSSDRSNQNRGYRDNSNNNYYGRGGGGRGGERGGDPGDRRRQRPGNWNSPPGAPPTSRRRHLSPERDALGELRSSGYRIPRGLPPLPKPEDKQRKTKHLALLVITIDDLPYEHLWRAWCQTLETTGKKDDYFISLACHAKFPKKVQSEWLRQRLLVYPPKLGRGNSFMDPEYLSRVPNWGSVEITRAMVDLLQATIRIGNDKEKDMRFSTSRFLIRRPLLALDAEEEEPIPPVDQFLFVSETCVPVATAQEVFEKIKDCTVSWVNARHRKDPDTPKNKYENDQFAGINRRIPGQYRWKADQWVLLCRSHVSQILNLDRPHIPPKHQLWQYFREINASDEMYFPTCLALLGQLRFAANGEDTQRSRSISNTPSDDKKDRKDERQRSNSTTSNEAENKKEALSTPPVELVLKKPVTYTDWSEGMRNPATFTNGLVDFKRVARLARDKGCLVARKFAPFVTVPGVAPENQKVTGQITVDEWKEEIRALREQEALRKPDPAEGVAHGVDEEQENEKENSEEEENEDEDEQEESFLNQGFANKKDEDGEEEEEESEEEEEEENQLE